MMPASSDKLMLPGRANAALVELAGLLQVHPEAVLADALDCIETAHGLEPRQHGRPMPRQGSFSTWTNLEQSLAGLRRRQVDLDEAFATHKRARQAKMRYAQHEDLWKALLQGFYAALQTRK